MWKEWTHHKYSLSHTNNNWIGLITRAEANWDERKCRKAATCDIFDLHLYVRNVEKICGETSHFVRMKKKETNFTQWFCTTATAVFQYTPCIRFFFTLFASISLDVENESKYERNKNRTIARMYAKRFQRKTPFFLLYMNRQSLFRFFFSINWTCANYRTKRTSIALLFAYDYFLLFSSHLLIKILKLCIHLRVARKQNQWKQLLYHKMFCIKNRCNGVPERVYCFEMWPKYSDSTAKSKAHTSVTKHHTSQFIVKSG